MKLLENGFELMSNAHHTNIHLTEIAAVKDNHMQMSKSLSNQKLLGRILIGTIVGLVLTYLWNQSQKEKSDL